MRFEGRVAFVTGGAKGIGAAASRLLAEAGAAVIIGDTDRDAGSALARQLVNHGRRAAFADLDVGDSANVSAVMTEAVKDFGGIDILLNNAGIALAKSVLDTTEEEWDSVNRVNLKGAWLCAKFAIPEIARRGGGAIVNIASTAGLVGFPNLAAYCAAKGGLVQLTRAMALECAPLHIRVNAVCPGHTRTPMGDGFVAAQPDPVSFVKQFIEGQHPIGRMAEADEIARTILFLASDEASFVTGAIVAADGGYTAR